MECEESAPSSTLKVDESVPSAVLKMKPGECFKELWARWRCTSSHGSSQQKGLVSTCSIDDLPDEVLMLIFSFVNVEDLVTSVQRVCWNWNRLCLNSDLWNKRVFSPGPHVLEETIVSLMRQMPFLQNVVYNSERSLLSLYMITENCPLLKKVTFCENQEMDTEFIIHLRERCPFIEQLTVPVDVLYHKQQCFNLSGMLNLKHLVFKADRCTMWEQPVRYLHLLGDRCPSLASIDLREVLLQHEDVETFFKLKESQLKRLFINCRTVTECVVPILSLCKVLEELQVTCDCTPRNQIAQSHFLRLRNVRRSCGDFPPFVKESLLSLTLNCMKGVEFRFMQNFFVESSLTQLTELTISNYFNYKDLLSGLIVRYCVSLRLLHLDYCHTLSDETVMVLPGLHHLESVSVEGARITSDGAEYLASCNQLKYLSIAKCTFVCGKGVRKFLKLSKLRTLKLDYCNLDGLFFTDIPKYLRDLSYLSIVNCIHVNSNDLSKFILEHPLRTVEQTKAAYFQSFRYDFDFITDDINVNFDDDDDDN